MGSQDKGKVNRLAGLLEEGLLASTSWLEEHQYLVTLPADLDAHTR